MKTNSIKTLLAGLLLAAAATPAVAGPDFTARSAGPAPLAASAEAKQPILPEDDVVFAHDSSALLDSGVQQIDRVARYLKKHKDVNIVVEGHANSVGTAKHNEDLATRRADMVRTHLIGHGIKSDRVIVLVYGEANSYKKPSPTDRRVVLFATREAATTIAKRALTTRKAISATWTRGDVLYTETSGVAGKATLTEQVANR